jgi:hypothetical protein
MTAEFVLSVVIAASTVVYTGINLLMLLESRSVRLQKITPHVVMYLKSTDDSKILALHVKNIGDGVAYNVKIRTISDYNQFGQENYPISDFGVLKHGFSAMPPNYELKFYIGVISDIYEKDRNGEVRFEVDYERRDKKRYREAFNLPFIQAIGQNYSTPPESFLGQIPYYLKEINSSLKRVEKTLPKL